MTLKHTFLLLFLAAALGACASTDDPQPHYGTINIKDIAMPRDSKIHYKKSIILGPSESWVGRLKFECSEDAGYMWDFMQSEMAKIGWTQLSGVRSTVSVLVFKREGRMATVQIQDRLLFGSHILVDVAPESKLQTGPMGGPSDYSNFSPIPSAAPFPSPATGGIQSLD